MLSSIQVFHVLLHLLTNVVCLVIDFFHAYFLYSMFVSLIPGVAVILVKGWRPPEKVNCKLGFFFLYRRVTDEYGFSCYYKNGFA